MKRLGYFQKIVAEAIKDDGPRNKMIQSYKSILSSEYELPPEIAALEWARAFVTTTPVDGVDAAVRVFTVRMPSLNIHPNSVGSGERDRAQKIEDALMWHFSKANQRGVQRPLEQILDSILKYGAVGGQVRYVPLDVKGAGKRGRFLQQQGDFVYIIHDIETMHPRYSPYMMESMSLAKLMTISDIEREIGADNPGVKELIANHSKNGRDQSVLDTTYASFYQFDDYDNHVQWATDSGNTLDESASGKIEFVREENKEPFLAWFYRQTRKALLQTVVESKSWENQCVILSLQYALTVALVGQARIITKTMDGRGVPVDFTNPAGQIALKMGEEAAVFPPPQSDPNLERQVQAGEQRIGQQVASRVLTAAAEIAQSAPFATFNAMLQTAISQLSDKVQTAEAALEDAFIQKLYWIHSSKIPLMGYRTQNRLGSETDAFMRKGSQVIINPEDFDPERLNVSVRLRPDTPTDRQTRLQEAILLHERFPISWSDALENAGMDNLEVDLEGFMQEKFNTAKIQAEVQRILNEPQMELIQAQQQAQMQQQQMQQQAQQMQAQQQSQMQQQQTQTPENPLFTAAQGQSSNSGGFPAAMVAPGQTRETITGLTQSGTEAMR